MSREKRAGFLGLALPEDRPQEAMADQRAHGATGGAIPRRGGELAGETRVASAASGIRTDRRHARAQASLAACAAMAPGPILVSWLRAASQRFLSGAKAGPRRHHRRRSFPERAPKPWKSGGLATL